MSRIDDPQAFDGVRRCPCCGEFVPDQEMQGDWCRACLTEYRTNVATLERIADTETPHA